MKHPSRLHNTKRLKGEGYSVSGPHNHGMLVEVGVVGALRVEGNPVLAHVRISRRSTGGQLPRLKVRAVSGGSIERDDPRRPVAWSRYRTRNNIPLLRESMQRQWLSDTCQTFTSSSTQNKQHKQTTHSIGKCNKYQYCVRIFFR